MNKSLRKIAYSLLNVFLAITAIFFFSRMAPGDPIERILGPEATAQEVTHYREQLGLNLPVYSQYKNYLKNVFSGDLGNSLFKKKKVTTLMKERFKPTIFIAVLAISISTILGVFLGILAGFYRSGSFDGISRIISLLCLSFPIFSLAPILVIIFSIWLGWLPVSEWGEGKHIVLPVLGIVIPLSAVIMRVTRNKFLEENSAPWVRVLIAKGLNNRAILLRLTKICLPTILTVVAIQLSVVLAGTIITETIFDIPGMGTLLFESIQNRDYPVVQGIIIYSTIIYMGVYFIIDFINSLIDPRIKS